MYSSLRYLEAAMPTSSIHQTPRTANDPSGAYLTLILLILVGLTISSFFKYRSMRKKHQIEILEQIWQQGTDIPR